MLTLSLSTFQGQVPAHSSESQIQLPPDPELGVPGGDMGITVGWRTVFVLMEKAEVYR